MTWLSVLILEVIDIHLSYYSEIKVKWMTIKVSKISECLIV